MGLEILAVMLGAGALTGAITSLLSVLKDRLRSSIVLRGNDFEVAVAAERQNLIERAEAILEESPERVESSDKLDVEEFVEQTRSQMDSLLNSFDSTLASLRSRLGSDIDDLMKQVAAQQEALNKLIEEVQQRKQFLELSKSQVALVEHLDSKIEQQTALIHGQTALIREQTEIIRQQSQRIDELKAQAELERKRARRSGWWNFALSLALAAASIWLGWLLQNLARVSVGEFRAATQAQRQLGR
jgi:DNA repair exonuclease SbcCD ATPase subunit